MAIACGNFALGNASMSLIGLLNEISADLDVPVAQAGQLTGASHLLAALLSPLIAFLTQRLQRRTLLLLALAVAAASQCASALAAGFWSLLAARFLLGSSIAGHTPTAAAVSGMLTPPEQRGSAISFAMAGFALASVVGVPLGVWFGGLFGWRATMAANAAVVAVALVWEWSTLPRNLPRSGMDLSAIGRVLANRPVRLALVMSATTSTGQMAMFAYFAPLLRLALGAGPDKIAVLMAVLGISSVLGNVLAMRFMDTVKPARMMRGASVAVILSLALWPLVQDGSTAACVVMLIVWSISTMLIFCCIGGLILSAGQELAGMGMALNSSCNFIGNVLGAALGGALISLFGLTVLPWACAVVYVCVVSPLVWSRAAAPRPA
jgi:predicted MFS family arabinose efflux permease